MKSIIKINLLILGVIIGFSSCKKEEASIGEPFSRKEGISGTWVVNKVIQVDEATPLKDERDLSEFYLSAVADELMEVKFDINTDSIIVKAGKGKNYFGASGIFKFVNVLNPGFSETAPDQVQVINNLGDTLNWKLLNPVREFDNQLGLQLVRCKLSYKFYFTRK